MSRNGLEVDNKSGLEKAKQISQLANLKVVGIMSHYPEEDANKVREDLARFKQQPRPHR